MSPPDYTAEAQLLKVIAHPVRLQILEHLVVGEKCVAEVEQIIDGVPQSSVSQHLALLRHSGVVDFRREGNRRCYFLTRPQVVTGLLAVLRGEDVPGMFDHPVLS